MFKKTTNPKIEELTKSFKERQLKLSSCSVTKDKNGKKWCFWCGEIELTKKNQKYCTPECGLAAFAWANPQKENGLFLLLTRQDWKCNICHYDYKPILKELHAWMDSYNRKISELGKEDAARYMKLFKGRILKPHSPEVDHIIPISKGGQSLGFSNTQAICFTCHKTKSKKDNSGPRKKRS